MMERSEGAANAQAMRLTAENFRQVTRGLPGRARMVLSTAMHLAKGSLTIRTPEGRLLRVGGHAPGPVAELILRNWNLPRRAFTGGTIGVAKSYMDGDWESPDVTSLLELFVVNVEAGEQVAGGASRLLSLVQRIRHWLNDNSPRGVAAQHLGPLRSRQPVLSPLARPHDDLLLGAVFDRSQGSRERAARQVPRLGARRRHRTRAITSWRSAAAGAASPSLRRARSAAGSPASPSPGSSTTLPARASPPPACRTRSTSSSATIARRPAAMTG